jgi:hypothetical protein
VRQLRDLIVRPVLAYLGLPGGTVAERLVLGTAAHESGYRYVKQVGGGPALSLWQIEPATARDALGRVPEEILEKLHALAIFLPKLSGDNPAEQIIGELPGNLYLGPAMARAIYFLKPFEMPEKATAEDLAALWKQHWNTPRGAGRPEQFVDAYQNLIAPLYPPALAEG